MGGNECKRKSKSLNLKIVNQQKKMLVNFRRGWVDLRRGGC